ncbi:PPE family protein, SVP subgroup [[Mycobacterium] nativiensis]|uniref:PPE domain-containing protein n=1 Tax=[Mycobacterium] nativiensis TaxID=2855503 RepID=A0ABU5XY85_9MYCO|nr:PPE domain-containing protein [Mycolicibacter sp. MYC340]MEB3031655.1 PPE domain-containing protein [Mycolicibacter sp. MYC340]
MDFAALPPEVNSARMYAGAGPGPMISAATAWDGVATELHLAATAYQSVVTELTSGAWRGPSAIAMAASVAPFVTWLNSTSAQAATTAVQAKSAVAAYEAAFAMVVPPPVIAANRAQLMTLLATNILGQNAAAIAATEAQYAEMWAQDATAMYGYASTSATAAQLAPFQPPPKTATGPGDQGASQAAQGNSLANNAQALLSKATSTLPGPGSADASPGIAATTVPADVPSGIFDWFGVLADELGVGVALPLSIVGVYLAGVAMYFSELDSREIFDTQDLLYGGQKNILDALSQLGATTELPSTENLRVPHESVKVAYGEAFPLGSLSTPISWAEMAPEIRHASFSTPLGSSAAAATPAGLGTAFGQMALAGMGGSALAGAVNRNRGGDGKPTPAVEGTPAQEPGSPAPASPSPVRPLTVPLAELAAGIRELGELHDAGYLTQEEFAEQKRRLLSR